jgi:hypothetical protein
MTTDRGCAPCNSVLGSRVDAALSDFFLVRMRRAKLRLSGNNGSPPYALPQCCSRICRRPSRFRLKSRARARCICVFAGSPPLVRLHRTCVFLYLSFRTSGPRLCARSKRTFATASRASASEVPGGNSNTSLRSKGFLRSTGSWATGAGGRAGSGGGGSGEACTNTAGARLCVAARCAMLPAMTSAAATAVLTTARDGCRLRCCGAVFVPFAKSPSCWGVSITSIVVESVTDFDCAVPIRLFMTTS